MQPSFTKSLIGMIVRVVMIALGTKGITLPGDQQGVLVEALEVMVEAGLIAGAVIWSAVEKYTTRTAIDAAKMQAELAQRR